MRDDQIWMNRNIVGNSAVRKRAARDIHIGKFSTSPLKSKYAAPGAIDEIYEADCNLYSVLDKARCTTMRI